jgi:hypothetical protein
MPRHFAPRLPLGLHRRRTPTGEMRPTFTIEGPWNYGDPVHELITERALLASGVIEAGTSYKNAYAWEFVRGVIWNDDPQGMLFDENAGRSDDFSSGLTYVREFNRHKKAARNGAFFGPGTPLLARSHFGDLQVLHAMATREGEMPGETRQGIFAWAELFFSIGIGRVSEETPLSAALGGLVAPWLSGDARTARQLFLASRFGSTRQRAIGALLHMIQDSHAEGHAERDGSGAIVEFHSYVQQDEDAHHAADQLHPDGLEAMPGALRAVEHCTRVLHHWRRARPWSSLRPFLEETIFRLSPDARPAGPGERFRPGGIHLLHAADALPAPINCSYKATGLVFDNDYWPDPDEQEAFDWGEPFPIVPGGSPAVFEHSKVVDGEVELRCILFFTMSPDLNLFVSGRLQLLEGTKRKRGLKVESRFGPFIIERGTFKDVYNTRLNDDEGDYATFQLSVANEGD